MIEVTNTVPIYEVDGKTVEGFHTKEEFLTVKSHWNDPMWVVIDYKGQKVTVNARDLRAAIENATNTNRF